MTRDEGVALIQEQLAFKTTLASSIVTYMQLAQTTLEKSPTKPWFLESAPTPLVSVAETELITLPTGFICEMEDQDLLFTDEDYIDEALIKEDYNKLKRYYKGSEPGVPEYYALLHESIALFPTPDIVYNFSWRFYKADTALTTNVENNWLKEVPLLLLGSTGIMIAGGPIRDKVAMDIFNGWINTSLAVVAKHNAERAVAGQLLQIGGAHN